MPIFTAKLEVRKGSNVPALLSVNAENQTEALNMALASYGKAVLSLGDWKRDVTVPRPVPVTSSSSSPKETRPWIFHFNITANFGRT